LTGRFVGRSAAIAEALVASTTLAPVPNMPIFFISRPIDLLYLTSRRLFNERLDGFP
jgi:hypothetical protein